MQNAESSSIAAPLSQGNFNYLQASAEHSLVRNGKVLTRRDADGSDAGTQGVDLEPQQITVENARLCHEEARCLLHVNGFELLQRPLENNDIDFFDQTSVTAHYYPECTRIVQEASGASYAAAFDHNIRSASGKTSQQRIAGGQQVLGPAHVVHGDYTLTSAAQRLRDLTRAPTGNDTLSGVLPEGQALLEATRVDRALSGGRFAIINVWRNIKPEPVATRPLALCDGQSVNVDDLVVFEIHYQDRVGENYFAKYSSAHRWYYYPMMTRDEALLIKQWDSEGLLASSNGEQADNGSPDRPCTFSFHSAFEDSATPDDAPDRWSIEVRCIALFD